MSGTRGAGSAEAGAPGSPAAAADPRTHRLAALVPAPVRRLLLDREPEELRGWHSTREVACLFADISGFTPLVEALAARKKEGLEQLRAVINRLFDALVSTTDRFGGEVLRYAGDAMTVLFHREEGLAAALADALRCAGALQAAMAEVQARLPRGLPEVGLKVGVGAGPLTLAVIGWPQMDLAFDGLALQRAIAAEHALGRGEIGLESVSRAMCGHLASVPGETRDGGAWIPRSAEQLLRALPQAAGAPAAPEALPPMERLAPFVLGPLYERVFAGSTDLLYEHRKLRILFLGFDGLDLARPGDVGRLDRYWSDVYAAVRRHGGFLDVVDIGDKGANLRAFFGAPVAIEAPWQAAAKTALDLVSLSGRHGLSAKAGLACGPVFCGETGARSRRQYAVVGEAINRSARLMSMAGPQQALLDPLLMDELGSGFSVETLPPRQLKGFSRPVAVGRLLGRRQDVGTARTEPLFGRAPEVEHVETLWRRAREGRGATVYLTGPPGIGKSRLAEELAARIDADGGLLLLGRGRPEERGVPLAGVRGAIGRLLGAERGNREEPQILARLLELVPGGAAAVEGQPEVALQSALAVVDRLLAEAAQHQPVGLVVEDLQWIDQASLELVRDQSRRPSERPMLLLVSAREAGLCDGDELELGPWDDDQVAQAARYHFGAELLDHDLERLVVGAGQGNPMMVRELCRHLGSIGRVEVSPYGQAYLTGTVGEDLPGSLEALMLARLDELPAETRRLLQVASCLGTDFELPALTQIAGLDEGRAAELLATALATGLVLSAGAGAWSFGQPILREIVHAALPRSDLRRLHARAADVLAERGALELPADPARMAYHYHLAARRRPAYRYARLAAGAARKQGLMAQALAHLDQAIDLLRSTSLRVERQDLPDLLAERAELQLVVGHPENAAADAVRLTRLARRRRSPEGLARGHLLLARAYEARSAYPRAMRAARRALRWAEDAGVARLRVDALHWMGILDFQQGRFDRAEQRLLDAGNHARRAEDALTQATIDATLGRLFVRTGQFVKSEQAYRAALQVFESQGDLSRQLRCLEGLGFVALGGGRFGQSSELASEALALSRRTGSRSGEAAAFELLSNIARAQGMLDLAESHLRQSLATYHRAGMAGGIASCTNNLAVLLHVRRQYDEAEALYLEALQVWERTGNVLLLSIAVNNLAELYEDRGESRRAEQQYQRALDLARQMRNPGEEAKALLGLARQSLREGRETEARGLLAACRQVAEAAGLSDLLANANQLLSGLRQMSL
jgi:class 3 adenylate cyclase/tetratricopeptide (TPR) repeat protein